MKESLHVKLLRSEIGFRDDYLKQAGQDLAATRVMRDRLLEIVKSQKFNLAFFMPRKTYDFSEQVKILNELIAEAESQQRGKKDRCAHDLSTESKVDKSDKGARV